MNTLINFVGSFQPNVYVFKPKKKLFNVAVNFFETKKFITSYYWRFLAPKINIYLFFSLVLKGRQFFLYKAWLQAYCFFFNFYYSVTTNFILNINGFSYVLFSNWLLSIDFPCMTKLKTVGFFNRRLKCKTHTPFCFNNSKRFSSLPLTILYTIFFCNKQTKKLPQKNSQNQKRKKKTDNLNRWLYFNDSDAMFCLFHVNHQFQFLAVVVSSQSFRFQWGAF